MPKYRVIFKPGKDGYQPPTLTIDAPNAAAAKRDALSRMRGGSTPNPVVRGVDPMNQQGGFHREQCGRQYSLGDSRNWKSGTTKGRCTRPRGHDGSHDA